MVNAGYASVSFFILLSGFVLGYNYNARARAGELDNWRFYEARFTRLYPIYLLSFILAWRVLPMEWGAHTPAMFWTGIVLAPLLLQGWIPEIATFLNTPAWTMSAEAFFYLLFPWMARWKRPERLSPHLAKMAGVWLLGMLPGALYMIFNPDGIPHPDRFSYGKWLQALKYTPLPHMASFVFGVLLAELDEIVPRQGTLRLYVGVAGFAGTFGVLVLAPSLPYAILHDGLLMPLFGCIILGLAGVNPLQRHGRSARICWRSELLSLPAPLQLLESDSRFACAHKLGLARFDPWISYVAADWAGVAGSLPEREAAQRLLRGWMHVWRD